MLEEPQLGEDAPWKKRFRAPIVWYTHVARHRPDCGLAISDITGKGELHAWDVRSGEMRQLTDRPRGTGFGAISPDGRYVYFHDDREGDETGHYVRIPYEGGPSEDLTPDMPLFSTVGFDISEGGSRLGFMAATPDGFTAYCIDVIPNGTLGTPRKIYHSARIASGPVFSCDGLIAAVGSTDRSRKLQTNLLALDARTGEQIGELWDGPETSVDLIGPAYFPPVPGDNRLLATSNRTGIEKLLTWDPRTGERRDLPLAGMTGAMRPFDWSPEGRRILMRTFNDAVQQLYVYDLASDEVTRLNTPRGTFSAPYFVPSGEIFAHWSDSTNPTQLIALDGKSGVRLRSLLAVSSVPPGRPWRSVSFPTAGGQTIQGWLGVPEGKGPFPTILETHGGPQSFSAEVFDPGSQAWLDHGFAYLSINYRGSTTFGKEFEESIWGHPGDYEVEDMAAAHAWLLAQGIAHRDQVLLTGASYGGYLTLHALGKRPDLWAGGMGLVAIGDWALMYEDAADSLRGYERALFVGTPEEKSDAYRTSSPITYAEHVRAPLLVIQGRNDTRCPSRQMEAYETKMRTLGHPIEVHWFDAGHGTLEKEQAIEFQGRMLRFAYDVLRKRMAR